MRVSDRSAQRGSRSGGEGEVPKRQGILFASSELHILLVEAHFLSMPVPSLPSVDVEEDAVVLLGR